MLSTKEVFGRTCYYDPETWDVNIIAEQRRSYSPLFREDLVKPTVLDIGGNRGYFASYAYSVGAGRVVSFEPDPTNAEIHRMNVPEGTLVEGGVGTQNGTFQLYQNLGINKGLHSTIFTRGRTVIDVKQYKFWEVVDEVKPDLVKIDCEGSEYFMGLLDQKFPDHVRGIAIEFDIKGKFVPRRLQLDMKAGNYTDEVRENVFFKTFNHIKEQFPVKMKDSSKGLTVLPWNVVYVGFRS